MKRLAYENVTGGVSHIDGMDTVVQIHQHSVINSPPLFPPTNLALSTALTYCTCHHAIKFNSQQELSHNTESLCTHVVANLPFTKADCKNPATPPPDGLAGLVRRWIKGSSVY